jgi:sugar/nucleoside kinase (ribokinase family)
MGSRVEVVAVGHAIVDVLAPSPDELVDRFGLVKGTMTLVDDTRAEEIYGALGPATEVSGGSAANTAACLASFGASVEFVGKVRADTLGEVFTHDLRASGVSFDVEPSPEGPGTGRALVLVTPDAEKTMCTNLGIGAYLSAEDVDPEVIAASSVLYLEGYLCGKPESRSAVEAAVSAARSNATLVAFSASDPSWVDAYTEELRALLDDVDILFANEEEAYRLSGAEDLDGVVAILSQRCPVVAVTLGAKGSLVAERSAGEGQAKVITVAAAPVDDVVDTTGAGDSFAAGFLYGVVNGLGSERSAGLGALAAAEVVSHLGARPIASLSERARSAGLL